MVVQLHVHAAQGKPKYLHSCYQIIEVFSIPQAFFPYLLHITNMSTCCATDEINDNLYIMTPMMLSNAAVGTCPLSKDDSHVRIKEPK